MKSWYQSKTLWVNAIAIVAIILNSQFGFEMDAEAQAVAATTILAVVNIVLRFFTNTEIER